LGWYNHTLMDYRYLKDESYYIDLYDLHTIEECLDYYWGLKKGIEEKRSEIKDLTPQEFDKESHKAISYAINVIKGERYRHKAETVSKWMDRDRQAQEKYDNALSPQGIRCKECYSVTTVTSKDLLNAYDENSQVLFMFGCTKCNKRQALYEDGREWHYEASKCPKCNHSLTSKTSRRKKDVLVFTYSCSNCSYRKTDIEDFSKSKKEREEKEAKDKKLLTEYRSTFCYNDEQGRSYIRSMDGISSFIKEKKEKEQNKDLYDKVAKIKKLTVAELEKLLTSVLEKAEYKRLELSKPEFERQIIVRFTIQDAKRSRNQYDSVYTLKKSIKNALIDTNWRLMSEAPSYKLGYLQGRLKGYETEEDLIMLVQKDVKKHKSGNGA